MGVSIILPALNEAGCIERVLAAVPYGAADEVLVIDGGSTDGTPELARAAGARVFIEKRRGYGRACATGVERAQGDLLVFLDADGADDPAALPRLLAPLKEGRADMSLGSRLLGRMEPGAMPWHQKAGNRFSAGVISALYRCHLTDLSPFRAVPKAALLDLNMSEMTYGWPTEMIVKAARRGWRLVEVPVGYRRRLSGQSKISGTVRGTIGATYFILRTIARYAWG